MPAAPLPLDVELMWTQYQNLGSVHKVAVLHGVTGDTVHSHFKKSGKKLNRSKWSDAETAILKDAYSAPGGVNINHLSKSIGRTHAAVACKAEELKLTAKRGNHVLHPSYIPARSRATKKLWKKIPHPRGMLGKKHTAETIAIIAQKGVGRVKTPESTLKMMKTRFKNHGTTAPQKPHGSWKSAWREIGGKRIYARSRWEANYARYLEHLQIEGSISKWEHEPETFWFESIKRGCRSYLPDFRVTYPDGSVEYHEVKGWMDARSKTKIKRMKKYHPSVKLVIRDAEWFKQARINRLHLKINGWECKNGTIITIDP
jgi:hypothetical protein